jgi:hypothetical protein
VAVDVAGQVDSETSKQRARRRKVHPLTPPPPASDFPPYQPRDFFRYEVLHQSKVSNARVGRIHTPHGASPRRRRISERGGGLTREVERPLPSNSPHDHMILRVDLVGSHARRWKRACLQTAHMAI